MRIRILVAAAAVAAFAILSCRTLPKGVETDPAVRAQASRDEWADKVSANADRMMEEGREVFRQETFGSEAFWGGQLGLHKAILGEKQGGVGPGLTPRQALQLGLKADVGAVPQLLVEVLQEGAVSFDNPETTLELLRAGAVVGVKGVFDDQENLVSVGITCALCHSTVDDSFMKGIGRRLDGWPNRDLDVGRVIALAPTLKPFADLLATDEATVKKVLLSWGPGKYDAELNMDGKAFRPDGKPAATLLPAAYGLAGVHLHTYTGFGSVTYWNAYVANTQMYGQGTFYDPRLNDPEQYPVAARAGLWNLRGGVVPDKTPSGAVIDKVSGKLASLHFYQLSIPAPRPPAGYFDEEKAKRGEGVFNGKAQCATCHVPPLFTEPGFAMHTPEEMGIDDFQANRSPHRMYRTTPLRGLFARSKGGFYHDGRFPDLPAVVRHYEGVRKLSLTDHEREDLVEYLKSL